MNKALLGQKIKKERKKRKLTQALLAGNKITRNMLSQIENGTASPSIETLEYLARELDIPLAYLLSDNDNLSFYQKEGVIQKIYRAYEAKNYQSSLNIIATLEELDSEIAYIGCVSAFERGRECITKGALVSAKKLLLLSLEYSRKTALNTNHVISLIPMYLAIAENVQAPLLEFDPDEYARGIEDIVNYELFKFLTHDLEYAYKSPKLKAHAEAKLLIKQRDYKAAINKLNEVAEYIKVDGYDAFLMFGVYADLEQCYKQLFDFENAYLYSSKRMSLIEGFKS